MCFAPFVDRYNVSRVNASVCYGSFAYYKFVTWTQRIVFFTIVNIIGSIRTARHCHPVWYYPDCNRWLGQEEPWHFVYTVRSLHISLVFIVISTPYLRRFSTLLLLFHHLMYAMAPARITAPPNCYTNYEHKPLLVEVLRSDSLCHLFISCLLMHLSARAFPLIICRIFVWSFLNQEALAIAPFPSCSSCGTKLPTKWSLITFHLYSYLVTLVQLFSSLYRHIKTFLRNVYTQSRVYLHVQFSKIDI